MKTYDVHMFYAVRITVRGVQAESQEKAIETADLMVDVKDYLWRDAEDDESGHLGALVDEIGDEEYLNTIYHEGPGAKNYIDVKEEPDEN